MLKRLGWRFGQDTGETAQDDQSTIKNQSESTNIASKSSQAVVEAKASADDNTQSEDEDEDNVKKTDIKNIREKRVFAPATFIISGGPNARHSRKCAICGRPFRADRGTWTRRVGGGLWTKDHPNLAKTLSEESQPVDPALDKEFDRCVACANARERSDVAAMAAHRLLPVLTGVDKVEYADGSVYIGIHNSGCASNQNSGNCGNTGELVGRKRHGKGQLIYPNGAKYVGHWWENQQVRC